MSIDVNKSMNSSSTITKQDKQLQLNPIIPPSNFSNNIDSTSLSNFSNTVTSPNISTNDYSVNQDTNNSTKQISTAKLERLMSEIKEILIYNGNNPIPAVITEQGARELNNKFKGYNNR